jgi:riboflavin kinase/FMN adenylyltransferase
VRRIGTNEPQAPKEVYQAVANIGFRPTVEETPTERPQVEALLLDFSGDLYGQYLELEFVARLREERRFDGVEALSAQIALDVKDARRALTESN